MEASEKLYIKGFNSGYIMARHEPELLKKLIKATPETDYIQGMRDGQKEHEKEMLQQKMMQHSQDKSKDKDR